jgi:hypothetical protein
VVVTMLFTTIGGGVVMDEASVAEGSNGFSCWR